jgi:hypothetical protein
MSVRECKVKVYMGTSNIKINGVVMFSEMKSIDMDLSHVCEKQSKNLTSFTLDCLTNSIKTYKQIAALLLF